ncbi:MAG: RNA 2',3'-cyclic phosphodiesterase [Candidatus Micrarchaeota archaeon]|nr:RNA 2',3'-cyclic phosphodiesterase [Candidatus Micrarchaeota archaeon]
MRLFVAVYPDEAARRALEGLQARTLAQMAAPALHEQDSLTPQGALRAPKSPWRGTEAGQLHLTLQFLGDQLTIHQQEEVENALEKVGGALAPFSMTCAGAGAFASPRRATILWAGLGSEEARQLAGAVAGALAPLGLKPDKPFAPHVTFARSKHPHDVGAWAEKERETIWCEAGWKVEKFALVSSEAVLGGHEHRVLKEYLLGGRA